MTEITDMTRDAGEDTISAGDLDPWDGKVRALAAWAGTSVADQLRWLAMAGIHQAFSDVQAQRADAAMRVGCPVCKAGGGPRGRRNFCRWHWPGFGGLDLGDLDVIVHPERVERAIREGHWSARDEDHATALGVQQYEANVIERARAERNA